jgi:hypothetical protein
MEFPDKTFLQHTCLRVGPVQDGKIAVLQLSVLPHAAGDVFVQ